MIKRLLFIAIIFIFLSTNVWADILYFKDGKTVEVESSREEGSLIKGMQFGVEMGYSKSSIVKIDKRLTAKQEEIIRIEEQKKQAEMAEKQEEEEREAKIQLLINTDNPGLLPSNDFVEATVKAYIKAAFFDPDSVKDLRISSTHKSRLYYDMPSIGLKNGQSVYITTIYLNGKNKFGAYVGLTRYFLWFRNSALVHVEKDDSGY